MSYKPGCWLPCVQALLLVMLSAIPARTVGHEVRPASLALTETGDGIFSVIWKQPLLNDRRLRINPSLPADCRVTARSPDAPIPGALVQTWQVHCDPGAFERQPIEISGLSSTLTDVWLTVRRLDKRESTSALLTAAVPRLWLRPNRRPDYVSYFSLGVTHLVFGYDHILFLMGLILLVRGWPRLLQTITAFTVAHSITLGASTLKLVHLSQNPVEAAIALSVLFLAFEASSPNKDQTITARLPWLVAFVFGLLHGLGFSGALGNIGLPPDQAAGALLFFNLGVEAGQIGVIAVLLIALYAIRRWMRVCPQWLTHAPVFTTGALSSYWLLQRLVPIVGTTIN